ncbi:flippase [bacterium]|nr:flippase [bacterium]
MNPTARIAKNSLVQIIAGIVNKIFGVVLIIFAARLLGIDGFGRYSFVLSMHAMFFIITDFGLGTLITRDLSREPEQESRYFINVLVMRVLLSLIAAGGMVGTVALLGHPSEVVILTAITAVSLVFTSNIDTCNAVFFARQRMEIPAMVSVVANTIRVTASLGALAAGAGVMTLLGIFTLAAAAHLVIILGMLLFFTRPIFSLDKFFWKKMIKEAYPLALANLFSVIYFRIDTVMIASIKGQEAVGYYSAAFRLLEFTMILPAYYCGSVFPVISAAYKTNHKRFLLIYRRSLKYLMVVSLPLALGAAALAPEIINLVYGPVYAASIPLLPILMWTLVLISANSISGPFLIAMGRQQIVARLILVGMLFNITMNAFAIPRYGIQGAAWVTLVSEVINISLFLVVLCKPLALDLRMIRYFIRPLLAGGVMYGMLHLIPGWDLGFKVLLGGVVYCLMLLMLKAFDPVDFELFRRVLRPAQEGQQKTL